jgi:SAM-dependent methyltransferase
MRSCSCPCWSARLPSNSYGVDVEPDEYRARAQERWTAVAGGWERRRAAMQASSAAVSTWMIDHVDPQPGQTILELAAGPGDTGLMAAELVAPPGKVIITDVSEAMIDVARRRADELGIANVEFKVMGGEWIDLPAASVDGVLCRWGYMLMLDPAAALRETRRVLRPGGHVAFAAWAAPEENPQVTLAPKALLDLGLMQPSPPDEPGPFAFAEPGHIEELLDVAGFDDAVVETVDLNFHYPTSNDVFETLADISPSGSPILAALSPADHTRLRDVLDERLAPFTRRDGGIELPARALVAAATA